MSDYRCESDHGATPSAFRRSLFYPPFLLGLFASVSAVLLVSGHFLTRDAIAERRKEDVQASLSQVLPDVRHDNDLLESIVTYEWQEEEAMAYRATRAGEPVAVAFPLSVAGYSGDISLLMGIEKGGRVLGVRVISHTETPGLGDKVEARKSDWIRGFDGLDADSSRAENLQVRKDGGGFDQLSGATITSRAVVSAVREGIERYESRREILLGLASQRLPPPDAPHREESVP